MNESTLALSLSILSFMMTVIWGGPLIRVLKHFKIGKLIRVEEPGHHSVKMGTPTMGGIMFILPVVLRFTVFRRMYEHMGTIRYVIMIFLLLFMAMMPIKMVLRWLFNLKYFIFLPEFSANL